MLLVKHLPRLVGYEENASVQNWFGTNARADVLYKPQSVFDLSDFFRKVHKDIPVEIIGACSNTLISDSGIGGVTIKLASKDFAKIAVKGDILVAGAGCLDSTVARFAAESGLSGLEFLATVPGTIGGAVKMNAGSFNQETFDSLVSISVMKSDGEIVHIEKEYIQYGYRYAVVNGIVLSANFRLTSKSPDKIKSHIGKILEKKSIAQPVREKTGGSTFCNLTIDDYFEYGTMQKAWEFIKKSGAFKETCGSVYVSPKHCNFIINEGYSGNDIYNLIEKIKKIVFHKFKINLKTEIKIMGNI
jgi:UDP-N-acetylmuramate dehydrogenase